MIFALAGGAAAGVAGIGIAKIAAIVGGALAFLWGGYELFNSQMENAKVEGEKEGYAKASCEYALKLREQYELFMKQLVRIQEAIDRLRRERDEARTLARRALTLVSRLWGQNPARKLEMQEQELRKQEQELGKEGFALLGKFEGCIAKLEEQGIIVDDKTMDYYEQLQQFTGGISAEVKTLSTGGVKA